MRVLVTGATGYIGGRLVPQLIEQGHQVRCLTRQPARLALDPWRDRVEVVEGDAMDRESLEAALSGCDAAFYLIHSMDGAGGFMERDRTAAANFRDAASSSGVGRMIYLGGLGSETDELSHHLSSRHEVGRILAAGSVPVTELRAAVIIGSGSVSFEMIRHLTEVLPVMTTPSWVRTRCQPVAIRDVLDFLVAALHNAEPRHSIVESGGPDVVTYEQMMQIYAEEAGLPKRRIIPVPVLSPRLSSLWVGLVTPLPTGVARPLIDSLRNEVVVHREPPHALIGTTPYRLAVRRALETTNEFSVETRWSDALQSPAASLPSDPVWSGARMLIDRQSIVSTASTSDLFWAFSRIGGDTGYYRMDWAWQLRGLLDQIVGGVGLRRGRRHPEELRPGEALDFWRVAAVEPGHRVLLEAEMKLPGTAWLEWVVEDRGADRLLVQTARFAPRGLLGRMYWWAMWPFHVPIFGSMARRIAATAEGRAAAGTTG